MRRGVKRGVAAAISGLALISIASLNVATRAASPPNKCDGKAVTVEVEFNASMVVGTPGDDFVIIPEEVPFYGEGGTDTLCDQTGDVIAVAITDEEGGPRGAPDTAATVPDLTTEEEQLGGGS